MASPTRKMDANLPANFTAFVGKRDCLNKEICVQHVPRDAMVVTAVNAAFWRDNGFVTYEQHMDGDWVSLADGHDTIIVDDCYVDDRLAELLRTNKRFFLLYQLPRIVHGVLQQAGVTQS